VYNEALSTYTGKKDFAIRSFRFFKESKTLLDRYQKNHPELTIYFPVFHPWNLILARKAKALNIRVVTTVHDYKTHQGEKSKVVEIVQNRIVQLSDKVIFLTENEKQKAIGDNKTLTNRSFVLEHPILHVSKKNTLDHTSQLNILFLGRLKQYKGYHLLSEIADNLDVGQITIAGDGDDSITVSTRVNLINKYLSEREISNLIQTHHILVLPYLEATQSGIITLGIQSEMVMIISDLPGLKEQLDDLSASWIQNNKKSLEIAIRNLQNDPNEFYEIKNNLKVFKERFENRWNSKFQKLMSS